ncbi:hypothetical protein [Bacillus sp. REN3]|uniref:hypothetical protein n=1 Tax=Bacillus sp. REN3 TaxID=2802440 RepID=UPI001AED9892|nr:hypothetical protein [Bacillus sp. REN3]
MKKTKFSRFENIYFVSVFTAFGIYAYNVQENWIIDVGDQLYNLMFFAFLFFVGMILTAIKATSKDGTVNKKAVLAGVSIAIVFALWRIVVAVA